MAVKPEEEKSKSEVTAYFDGKCNLCSNTVRFANSRTENVEFVSLQSEKGKDILQDNNLESQNFETFILEKNGKVYFRSDALIELMKEFGGLWKLLSTICELVPKIVRDQIYSVVSKYRFKIFGRRDTCFNAESPD